MQKSILNKKIIYLSGIVFCLVLWSLISLVFDDKQLIFPNIFKVLKYTFTLLSGPYLYKCLFNTLLRMLCGFIIALMLGLFFGIIAGMSEKVRIFLAPLMIILKTIPTASLVFLFLVLSGAKNTPVYIVTLISFPILYEATSSGFINTDKDIIDTLKIENGKQIDKIIRIRLPLALPYLHTGIASCLGLSFKIEIMAEILAGSTTKGLGSAISFIQKSDPSNMTGIFAYSLVAIAIAVIFDLISRMIIKDKQILGIPE